MFNRSSKAVLAAFAVMAFSATAFAADAPAKSEVKDLARVEVTGSRLAEDIRDIPAPTYVVTREEIENSGARDLQEVLNRVPGVNGIGGSASLVQGKNIAVRGLNSEVLLLVDGIPFMDTHNGTGSKHGCAFDLRGFDLSSIERIEIVKGASSALYGSTATGGVVNVITRKGSEKSSGYIRVDGGSKDYYKGTIRGTAVMSDDLKVTLGYSHTEEKGAVKLRKLDNDKLKNLGGNYGVGLYDYSDGFKGDDYSFRVEKGNWKFVGDMGESKSHWFNTSGSRKGKTTKDNHQKNDYKRFSLNYADGVNTAYAFYNGSGKLYETPKIGTLNDYDDKAFGFTYNRRQDLFGLNSVFGFDYKHENGTMKGGKSNLDYDLDRDEIAPYIETTVALGAVNMDLGLRYEHWDIDEGETVDEIIPRVSFNYETESGKLLYATAGRVFTLPSFYQLYLPMADDSYTTYYRNKDLDPEKGWTYDLGIKDTKAKNPWSFGLFYMNIDNKLEYNSEKVGSKTVNQYQNRDEYRAWGIEGDVTFNLTEHWSYKQSFAWIDADIKKTSDSDWTRSDAPRLDLSGFLNYHNGAWNAELSYSYYADRDIAGGFYEADNMFITNFAVNWKNGAHTLQLACNNLFDKEYVLDKSGYINGERRIIASWQYNF